ncbi:protease HtpX [Aquisalimonas sp.]|uniref:protease HtpX n=1 Tax=Aquisalimonas sp. TaxID=1872621 RepID=UPI0025C6E078|nr:protease HtpX [Aquisalimonas sp.]
MKRITLFLMTNLGIVVLLGIMLNLFVEPWMAREGMHMNTTFILVLAAIFGMGGAFVSLAMSKMMAKRMTGAKVIDKPSNPSEQWLVDTVRRHARQAGIGMPEVAIYDAPEINAFATGMKRDDSLVAVSTGLLRQMSADEAEAVIGHEVAHIQNGDMVTLALIQGVLNTFVIVLSRVVGMFVDKVIFKNERGYGPGFWITVIFAQVVLGLLASMIVQWFSRQREYRADLGGAKFAGREKMVAALEKLKKNVEPSTLPEQVEAFGISGRVGTGIKRLMMSHPPLDDRIAALRERRYG